MAAGREVRASSDSQVGLCVSNEPPPRRGNGAGGGGGDASGAKSGTGNSSKSNSQEGGNNTTTTNNNNTTASNAGASSSGRQVNSHRGKTLGEKWILGDEIGRGAYASVFKGLDLKKGGFVAIKQFSLSGVGEDELAGIMQEIDLLKELRHKNIVEYFGSLRSRSHLYIIMEYVENGSLANIVRPSKFGSFPESLVAVYVAQVLEGLAFLHDQGVIHRDIKGANILTTKEGIVKLADFGVAIRFGECSVNSNGTAAASGAGNGTNGTNSSSANGCGTPVTQSVKSNAGAVVGTPYWMAPEVIEMSGVTEKSDIWSVGCTAIELLTSSPPYFDLQPMSAMFRIVQDDFVPLPSDVSEAMLDFLQQCFNKEPKLRPDAKALLTHPWIVTSKKQLQKSWRQQREKLGSKHEDIASVVERMVEHDVSGGVDAAASAPKFPRQQLGSSHTPAGTPKVFSGGGATDETTDIVTGTDTPGFRARMDPAMGGESVAGDAADDIGGADETSFMAHAGQGGVPNTETLAAILADVSAMTLSDVSLCPSSMAQREGQRDVDASSPSTSTSSLEGSEGKLRLELAEMQSLISALDSKRSDVSMTLRRLEELLRLKPERRRYFADHGVNQLMVCLEDTADVNVSVLGLRVVQLVVLNNIENLEKFCLLGLVPAVIRLSSLERAPAARNEAASLVFQMCLGSLFTAQTFVACQGIGALATFIPLPGEGRGRSRSDGAAKQDAKSICERSAQAFMAVDSIWQLIELKITGKRGEICSLFARSRLVERLVALLWSWAQAYDENDGGSKSENSEKRGGGWWLLRGDSGKRSTKSKSGDRTPGATSPSSSTTGAGGVAAAAALVPPDEDLHVKILWKYCEKIISLMLVLARSSVDVKAHFCGDATAHRLIESMDLVKKRSVILGRLLQCIRSLTSEPTALEPLQRAGAIQALVPMMQGPAQAKANASATDEVVRNEALHAIFNLCHINRTRQEQAALAGVISPLLFFASRGLSDDASPSSVAGAQQALQLLFALAHASRRTRTELWRHDVLQFYLNFLDDERWQLLAFDAIVVWLVHEASIVEGRLLQRGALKQLMGILTSADGEDLLGVLELFLAMLTKSKKLCVSLASLGLSQVLINLLERSDDPHVKLTLLKVLRVMYEHHPRPREVSSSGRLKSQLKQLVEAEEEMVLMKQISQALLTAFNVSNALV